REYSVTLAGCCILANLMDQSVIQPEKMELVVVTHVVDAITFWAQNVTEKINEKINVMLTEKCPGAPILMGRPSSHKASLWGTIFRGQVLVQVYCATAIRRQGPSTFYILYIDYGNTEIVSRSDLVELPEELQTTGLAKKYKFWRFHVSSEQDSPLFSQGKSFLHNMIHGKKLRVHKKEQKTSVAVQPVEKLNAGQEPLAEIQSSKTDVNGQQLCSQDIEQAQNETESELQRMREVINDKDLEIKKLKEEGSAIQQHASLLGQQLEEAKLELQILKESYEKTKETEHNHPTTFANRISQLARKVDSLRKLRQNHISS
ncbi:hypothetical protein cypCar_00000005, partial [Cyprinus carpio]